MSTLQKTVRKVPGIAYGTAVLLVLFTCINPNFINPINLVNILKNAAILTIVSMGMTLAILSAQIDLSIGSVMSLCAIVTGLVVQRSPDPSALHIAGAVVLGVGVGALFGLFNGVMIGRYKFDYWLITFSSMSIAQGLALIVSNGNIISGYTKRFRALAEAELLGVDSVIYIAVAVCAVAIFISTKTRFGFSVYGIGDSEECAVKSGIDVTKTRLKIYVISGILAGIGGILLAAKTNSASSTLGSGYEFNAIAAVVVGGTPFDGGKGGLMGTVLGSLLIAVMKSGLQVVGLSPYWQTLLVGVFIMLIIVADVASGAMKAAKDMRRVYRDET